MQPGTYSMERSLEDCINNAIQKAVKNPCGPDPFGSELRAAMDTFASSLPSCLQKDRITTRETLPASRKVTVTSVSNEDQNKKTSHPLISSVNLGVIVLNQPIFYTVKKGDTLSEISWKLTGRKASVRDLKNWNTIWDDNIRPGQVLYLADPYDSFVKEIASKLSKHELTGRNPKVSLDRLSGEMVAQHGGLFREKHQVEIQLEFRERPEEFLNPEIFEKDPVQDINWAPGFSGGSNMANNFDQPHYPNNVRLRGGDFVGRGENPVSTTDIALAGVGTSAMVGEILTKRIIRSRSGFTSGKISSYSPRSYSKATATKINFATKGIGWGLTLWSVYNTERQFENGQIDRYRKDYNHLNNGVGVVFPITAIPIAVGDYYGQKYADEIVNDVSNPGGILFESTKFVLELVGIPIEPEQ